jgi:hypothetical protein
VNEPVSEVWSRRRLSTREARSAPFENLAGSDVCDKEGLFCIILSIACERVETSEAR